MSDVVIKLENISKQYRLGTVGTQSLTGDLQRWWYRMRGKEDPFLKIGEENKLSDASGKYVWALRDISLEVKQGEVLGIIGKNGAGKSTLLKLLSRVTGPTTGNIKVKGRIASLLEVGTGFHPELTGRENIFLNGAILGMTKNDIRLKLDEIVDFAGVAKYLDTPVKRYSSGMYVRLAFAVAAHLEPDILVVDEVLAVGDAEFQKKAIGKMQDVSTQGGRTVLFVSHNMTAIKNLCRTGIVMEQGAIDYFGEAREAVRQYLYSSNKSNSLIQNWLFENAPGKDAILIKSAKIKYNEDQLTVNTPFDILIEFWNLEDNFEVNISMHLYDEEENCVFVCISERKIINKGLHRVVFHIPKNLLNTGRYYISNMFVSKAIPYFFHTKVNFFEIVEDRNIEGWHGKWSGSIRPTFIKHEFYFVENI